MDWQLDVHTYLQLFEISFPEEYRPNTCPVCQHSVLHHHGKYSRHVLTIEEDIEIPIYRFKCAACAKTFSLLPSFIGKHQQVTWDVQEEVFAAIDEGEPLETAAVKVPSPIGPFSSKTVWRWHKDWALLLEKVEHRFWQWALKRYPSLSFPDRKQRSLYQWFQVIWEQIKPFRANIGVFHGIQKYFVSVRQE